MIRTDRLLDAARALRETPTPQTFIMSRVHTCGTPHCVIGHYVARRDLQCVAQLPVWDESVPALFHCNSILYGVWGATRRMGFREFSMEHFGLNWHQVELLFSHHGCNGADTAEEAAEFIEKFVAQVEASRKPGQPGAGWMDSGS